MFDGSNNPPLADQLALDHEAWSNAVEALADRANNAPRQIDGLDDLTSVKAIVVEAKQLAKRIDAVRVTTKQPYLDAGRVVDGFFGGLTKRLERIEKTFQFLADDYARALRRKQQEEDDRRRKAEQEAARAREEEQRRLQMVERARTDAARSKHEQEAQEARAAAEAAERAAAPIPPSFDPGPVIGTLTEWVGEITDYEAVPLDMLRRFLKREEVERAVKAAVRAGVRSIPGVHIFEDVKANLR